MTEPKQKKQRRPFKRIRGILRGGSRRQKIADESSSPSNSDFRIVVLVMELKSRRFELMQLEFESPKARVSDVLNQIRLSVSEEVLRKQTYTGIAGVDEKLISKKKLLADVCRDQKVFVAIPSNVATADCVQLGKTILGDEKVAAMLRTCVLKVVLLLMEPKTRRFELLHYVQVDSDSSSALVSDVLAQIPQSATETAFRDQTYKGISGPDQISWGPTKRLAEIITHNNGIFVAVPSASTAAECVRLAKPILGDEKVKTLLATHGLDTKAWSETCTKVEVQAPEEPNIPVATQKQVNWPRYLFVVFLFSVLVALLAWKFKLSNHPDLLQQFQPQISATVDEVEMDDEKCIPVFAVA